MKDKMELIGDLNVLATDMVDLISTFATLEEDEIKELDLYLIDKHLNYIGICIDKIIDLLG